MRQKLALLAFELGVEENRGFDGIPVVDIVWRRLEIPDELSGIGVQRHNRAGVQIVAGAAFAGEHGIGVAGAPVKQIESGVVGSGHPGHAAAVKNRVAVFGPSL